jgi:D-psicose/D-tagatose/L-ribulose 3-epimerase
VQSNPNGTQTQEQAMKIGVSAFAWTTKLNQRHLKLLPSIREYGIDGFEIAMFDPADLNVPELRNAFASNGLECTVCAILPPGINPISTDSAERTKARAHLAQCIETAAEIGAHRIGGPLYAPIGYLPGRRRTNDEWCWAVEYFQSLGDMLQQHEMTLGIEPVNRSETFFLNTTAEACALCDEIGNPRIGVLIDTFHANIEEKNLAEAVHTAGQRLVHLHASENDRGLVGSGHVDFPAIVTALKQINYAGYLMIEGFGYSADEPDSLGALWGDMNVTPEDIAYQGATYLRGVLEQVSRTA